MSKYSPIYQKMWNDRDFLKSSKDAKLIFIYLTTNEAVHISGIYEIPISTISYFTGIPSPTVEQVLSNGSIKNVVYDLENEMVFLVNRLKKYSQGGNPAQVEKGVLSQYEQNSKTPLWNLFLEVNPQFKEIFSTVDQPLTNPYPKGSLPLPLKDLNNNKTPSNKKNEEWFEEDWKDYPKGGNKQRAKQSYLKSVTSEERRKEFQEKTRVYLASVSDPKYYKNGDTWFNQWGGYEVSAIVAKPERNTQVRKNLDLIKNIDLGGENDNGRIQTGGGDNVRFGPVREFGAGNNQNLERIAN